ncbi:MAG: diphthamide synthesis protein [Nanoarchaeota archaeon]|jgi:2-(3-amino-3-carboxypropyl)histidine synthase|nr:diphthamide synthesis protein [Nanoarchaeota archaeon]
MKEWTIEDLNDEYELDLDKAVKLIKEEKAKLVLVQFPDGLKQYATVIVDFLEEKTNAEFFIHLGDCFGACDTPVGMDNLGIDLMIQIGHNALMPNYLTQ